MQHFLKAIMKTLLQQRRNEKLQNSAFKKSNYFV